MPIAKLQHVDTVFISVSAHCEGMGIRPCLSKPTLGVMQPKTLVFDPPACRMICANVIDKQYVMEISSQGEPAGKC